MLLKITKMIMSNILSISMLFGITAMAAKDIGEKKCALYNDGYSYMT